MEISQNISMSSSYELQSTLLNNLSGGSSVGKGSNTNAYYAKKGEPMYMKEMDSDEDGVVTFDEFKDYCQANGISTKEMIQMAELASSYRTMQAEKKAEQSINEQKGSANVQTVEMSDDAVYARRGDGKYDEAMDTNSDDKVTYKEYMEYCQENSKPQEQKANTKVQETDDGEFKTTSSGKALSTYSQNESAPAEGKVDDEA